MAPPFTPPPLPKSLQAKSQTVRLGADVPALVAHPDGETPVPVVLWMHGRTAYKELDPGRYQRWLRAGIGAVSLDLPGHGERFDAAMRRPDKTLEVLTQMVSEIDRVVEHLAALGPFDTGRLAIGGMSAGGMASLIRLCSPHTFKAAAVECTTGDLRALYFGDPALPEASGWPARHDPADVARLDPGTHLSGFAPIPLLALHTVGDLVVPWPVQQRFLERLGDRYQEAGAASDLIEIETFQQTGAEEEHAGFGRFSALAKDRQTAFFARALGASPVG